MVEAVEAVESGELPVSGPTKVVRNIFSALLFLLLCCAGGACGPLQQDPLKTYFKSTPGGEEMRNVRAHVVIMCVPASVFPCSVCDDWNVLGVCVSMSGRHQEWQAPLVAGTLCRC